MLSSSNSSSANCTDQTVCVTTNEIKNNKGKDRNADSETGKNNPGINQNKEIKPMGSRPRRQHGARHEPCCVPLYSNACKVLFYGIIITAEIVGKIEIKETKGNVCFMNIIILNLDVFPQLFVFLPGESGQSVSCSFRNVVMNFHNAFHLFISLFIYL